MGDVICPGLYAGRIGDRVKIGFSLNLPQRVDAFLFEELIAILPLPLACRSGESEIDFAYRVRDTLKALEHEIHGKLEHKRVKRLSRAGANEWFHFDCDVLDVLRAAGAVSARARPGMSRYSPRVGRLLTFVAPSPSPALEQIEALVADLVRLSAARS